MTKGYSFIDALHRMAHDSVKMVHICHEKDWSKRVYCVNKGVLGVSDDHGYRPIRSIPWDSYSGGYWVDQSEAHEEEDLTMSEQKTYDFIDALHRMKHEGKKMQSVHGGTIYFMKDGYLMHSLDSRCSADVNAYFMINGRASQYVDYIEPFDYKKLKPGDRVVRKSAYAGGSEDILRFIAFSMHNPKTWYAEYEAYTGVSILHEDEQGRVSMAVDKQ